MNIQKLIAALSADPYFTKNPKRSISTDLEKHQSTDHLIQMQFEDENDPNITNSILILRGKYRPQGEQAKPGYVMVTTNTSGLKYDLDFETIFISLIGTNGAEGTVQSIPADGGEAAFFQESLMTDFRHITYDNVQFVKNIAKIFEELEKEEEE